MEELQSTEVLDREILEDARKKALRVMQSCEDTIIAQDVQWKNKLNDAVCEMDIQYKKNREYETNIIIARLPVDKLKVKLNKLENLLADAVVEWYKNLSRGKILNLLSRELTMRVSLCGEHLKAGKINAQFGEMERKEAESLLKMSNVNNFDLSDNSSLKSNSYPIITLETEKVKIIISMEKIIDEFIQNNRFELTEALVGGEFLGEV